VESPEIRRKSTVRGAVLLLGSLAVLFLGGADGGAERVPLPPDGEDKHLGVRECAGGPCHGSATPVGDRVKENEHTIWLRQDPHAKAYKTLLTEASLAIARNYGLEKPPSQEDACLGCHANNPKNRGPTFTVEDGVGCEGCHGGAERWLKTHTSSTRKHADNVSQGMFPADRPTERAELCISCHFGTNDRFVSHRMLGAGHPRLRFELDSYQVDQPAHYTYDADYSARGKETPEPLRLWAVGQAVYVRELLAAIGDPKRNRDGIWPEFAVLDCYTCHHAMEDKRRPQQRWRGLGTSPGTPRLNDSAFLMLRHILVAVDPRAADLLRDGTRDLHLAISASRGDRAEIARRLVGVIDNSLPRLEDWKITAKGITTIAVSLIDEGLSDGYRDYPSAEQAASAIQSLADTRNRLDPYSPKQLDMLNDKIQMLLEVTKDGDRFNTRQERFVETLREVRNLLG
jgi:hypothetical protein